MKDYCESKSIERKIGDTTVTFYPLPIGVLFKCRSLGESVSKMLAAFFADTSKDTKKEEIVAPTQLDGNDKVFETRQNVVQAIEPSMASLRLKHREDGIKALVDALMGDKTQEIISEMIVRSARKEFKPEDAKDLMDKVDMETFKELIAGVLEANKGVFAGMGELLSRLTNQEVAAGVKEKLSTLVPKQEN